MADKDFNINEECLARHIRLVVPPGKQGQSQMIVNALKTTGYIAKMRIIVEGDQANENIL